MRVARGSASWLSSHGRGLGPRDALKKDSRGLCRGAPGESGLVSRGSQGLRSPLESRSQRSTAQVGSGEVRALGWLNRGRESPAHSRSKPQRLYPFSPTSVSCSLNSGKGGWWGMCGQKLFCTGYAKDEFWTSLVVQWLRLRSQCRGPRFYPWSGN